MEYVYAALMLHKLKKEITEENVTSIVKASGTEVNEAKVKSLVASLADVNIEDAIKSIYKKATYKNINNFKLESLVELYNSAIKQYENDPKSCLRAFKANKQAGLILASFLAIGTIYIKFYVQ